MGYRHHLGLIKKEDFKKINQKFIDDLSDCEEYVSILTVMDKLPNEYLLEIGKESDEGYLFSDKIYEASEDLKESYEVMKQLASDYGHDFNILTAEDLIKFIECYFNRIVKYWKHLVDNSTNMYDSTEPDKKCVKYVKDLLGWSKFLINTDLEQKWHVQDTWKYEYEIFNLIHILKSFDWDNDLLIIYGY